MWSIAKTTGRALHPDLEQYWDWPNTITYIISLRMRYDSYQELLEVPPEEHWDYSRLIRQHIERLYPTATKNKTGTDLGAEEVED